MKQKVVYQFVKYTTPNEVADYDLIYKTKTVTKKLGKKYSKYNFAQHQWTTGKIKLKPTKITLPSTKNGRPNLNRLLAKVKDVTNTLSKCLGSHPILHWALRLNSKIKKNTGATWFSTGELSKNCLAKIQSAREAFHHLTLMDSCQTFYWYIFFFV